MKHYIRKLWTWIRPSCMEPEDDTSQELVIVRDFTLVDLAAAARSLEPLTGPVALIHADCRIQGEPKDFKRVEITSIPGFTPQE